MLHLATDAIFADGHSFGLSCHRFALEGTRSPIALSIVHFGIVVQLGGWWMGPRPFTMWQMVIHQNQVDNYPGFPPVPGPCLKVQQTCQQWVCLAPRATHTHTLFFSLDISIVLPFQCNLLLLFSWLFVACTPTWCATWVYKWYGGHIPPLHLMPDCLLTNQCCHLFIVGKTVKYSGVIRSVQLIFILFCFFCTDI